LPLLLTNINYPSENEQRRNGYPRLEFSLRLGLGTSDEDKESKSTSAIGTTEQIMGPNGKATVAAPKLSDDDHVEMEEILSLGSAANPDEDIMQLARLGDIQGIEKLLDSGKFDGTYADAEGITPLHVCIGFRTNSGMFTDISCSGRLSTTNMPCASFS
jgi:hypothetical protein